MTYRSYPLFVFGFHGCDRSVAEKVLAGEEDLQPSDNPYDWLGTGVYFWENAPERALQWAQDQKKKEPYVVGAIIQLSYCFNLMDKGSALELKRAYDEMSHVFKDTSEPLPENKNKQNNLDALIINTASSLAERRNKPYDAVRGAFIEGGEVFPGSAICGDTHIQLCVRNRECIQAYFRPKKVSRR